MKTLSIIALTTTLLATSSSSAFAQDPSGSQDCTILGAESVTMATPDAVAAATAAQIVRLDCPGYTPSAEVLDAALANEAISTALGQESIGSGEILAVGIEAGNAVVYVSDSEE